MILQLSPTILVDTPIVKHFGSNDIIVCTNFTFHINEEKNCFNHNSDIKK